MKFILSKHFKQRIAERGISVFECEETVKSPTKKTLQAKGEQGGFIYKYEKDFGDKKIIITVIGENLPSSKNIKLVTAWKIEK